jgi:hypothetical protein
VGRLPDRKTLLGRFYDWFADHTVGVCPSRLQLTWGPAHQTQGPHPLELDPGVCSPAPSRLTYSMRSSRLARLQHLAALGEAESRRLTRLRRSRLPVIDGTTADALRTTLPPHGCSTLKRGGGEL